MESIANKLVLLAEDDKFQQESLKKIFTDQKIPVVVVADGEQATTMFKAKASSIGLVILDLNMPKMDGFEAATKMRELGAKCKIVGVSVDEDSKTIDKALKAGMDKLIKKPVNKDAIAQIFQK